ncbi:hypothetical protein Scep_028756 [Stephania cephalantha]|uniref:Uncharacterized protein n=1 Tax=Stephania cephalantha TaxID=152367 RepID=A0AAP0EAK0_9MAGN
MGGQEGFLGEMEIWRCGAHVAPGCYTLPELGAVAWRPCSASRVIQNKIGESPKCSKKVVDLLLPRPAVARRTYTHRHKLDGQIAHFAFRGKNPAKSLNSCNDRRISYNSLHPEVSVIEILTFHSDSAGFDSTNWGSITGIDTGHNMNQYDEFDTLMYIYSLLVSSALANGGEARWVAQNDDGESKAKLGIQKRASKESDVTSGISGGMGVRRVAECVHMAKMKESSSISAGSSVQQKKKKCAGVMSVCAMAE